MEAYKTMNARTLIVLVLFLICSVSLAADPARMTRENYNKIKLGQDEAWVVKCIGKESSATWEHTEGKCLEWERDQPYAWILITFENGKVVRKAQSGLK